MRAALSLVLLLVPTTFASHIISWGIRKHLPFRPGRPFHMHTYIRQVGIGTDEPRRQPKQLFKGKLCPQFRIYGRASMGRT